MANAPGQGRPAKPTAILNAQGTARKDRHADRIDGDLPVLANAPDAPDTLGEFGAKLWDAVVQGYEGFGVITAIDLPMLERMCSFYQRHVEIENEIGANMYLADDDGNPKPNPLYKASLDYWKAVEKIAPKFGLSPSSRAKLRVAPTDDGKPKSKWSGL